MIDLKHFVSTVLVLASTLTASAEIRETNFMANALANTNEGDVVVLDIDNTVLEPVQTLGSDQWFGYLLGKYKKSGLDENTAVDKAIIDWIQVQELTKVRLVENTTPDLIKSLQNRKIMVFALTARPVELKRVTAAQLRFTGIRFQKNNALYTNNRDIELYKGILFVGPKHNKGTVLQNFFQTLNIQPKRLIFIDDKEKHVKNMDDVFARTGLININFRYGAADSRVRAFNATIAEIQWDYFQRSQGILLSDEEAQKDTPSDFVAL
jgi:hypothetical protein